MEAIFTQIMQRASETVDDVEEFGCARTAKTCGMIAADAVCCVACCNRCGGSWSRERAFVLTAVPGILDVETELDRMQQTCLLQLLAAVFMPLTCCGCCFGCCGACIYPVTALVSNRLRRVVPEKVAEVLKANDVTPDEVTAWLSRQPAKVQALVGKYYTPPPPK